MLVFKIRRRPVISCPFPGCPAQSPGQDSFRVVRKGYFRRASDCRRIQRFWCHGCGRTFSDAIRSDCYRQKKRTLNDRIFRLSCSAVSERRLALELGVSRTTIARKMCFLNAQARRRNEDFRQSVIASGRLIHAIQFDEMETFERSKCLPLSIPLVVEPNTRKILALGVARMPATGLLVEKARRKYGRRPDERARVAKRILRQIAPLVTPDVEILTDQKPQYPLWIRRPLPHARHQTTPGRRGCDVGQGELKRGGWDPLFALNHTAAMLRANVNRLIRKTWCTTKRADRLEGHLQRYILYHNERLTQPLRGLSCTR